MSPIKRYILNVLIWLDEGFNALVFLGSPEETISSRSAKARNAGKKWGCVLCKFLDFLDKGHCDNALMSDEAGADAIIPDDKKPTE